MNFRAIAKKLLLLLLIFSQRTARTLLNDILCYHIFIYNDWANSLIDFFFLDNNAILCNNQSFLWTWGLRWLHYWLCSERSENRTTFVIGYPSTQKPYSTDMGKISFG